MRSMPHLLLLDTGCTPDRTSNKLRFSFLIMTTKAIGHRFDRKSKLVAIGRTKNNTLRWQKVEARAALISQKSYFHLAVRTFYEIKKTSLSFVYIKFASGGVLSEYFVRRKGTFVRRRCHCRPTYQQKNILRIAANN